MIYLMRTYGILLAMFAYTAYAKSYPVVISKVVQDHSLAEVRIIGTNVGEPVLQPIVLKVSVLCRDNRANPKGTRPAWINLLSKFEKTCEWGRHDYDPNTRKLTLVYSKINLNDLKAPCEPMPEQTFDLAEICKAWN